MKDHDIISLFQTRSEEAITALSGKYGKLCYSVANNILHNHEDTEECVNDSYFGVWNSIPPKKPDSLMAYTCRLVRNFAVNKYHHNTAKKRNSTYDVALEELEHLLVDRKTPETELETKEYINELNLFVSKLDKVNGKIFTLRYYFADSVETIGKKVGLSESAVTARLGRIRKKLKAHFKKNLDGWED